MSEFKTRLHSVPSGGFLTDRDKDKKPILDVRELGIDFGGLTAVDNFNLMIGRNEIAGLIGLLARLAASEIGLVVIATTAGRTRFGCGIIGGLTTGASRFGLVLLGIVGHGKRQIELRFRGSRSRSRRLGGHVSIVCGVGLSGIGLRSLDDLGGFGGLGGAHGHTGRRLSTIARRLQGGEQLGLAHGRRAAQAHLFSELFELRQLHILKILAICHWLPFPYRTDPCLSRR
mgnify:CR=1 FL=1